MKRSTPTKSKTKRSSDLPEREKLMIPEREPEEQEPEPEPPKMFQMSASNVDESFLVDVVPPAYVASLRLSMVKSLVEERVNEIITDIQQTLLRYPDQRQAVFQFPPEIPDDGIVLVIASLANAGWDIRFDGQNTINIMLPAVPLAAPPIAPTVVSKVNAL